MKGKGKSREPRVARQFPAQKPVSEEGSLKSGLFFFRRRLSLLLCTPKGGKTSYLKPSHRSQERSLIKADSLKSSYVMWHAFSSLTKRGTEGGVGKGEGQG